MLAYSRTLHRAAAARTVLGLHAEEPCTPANIKKAFREKALTAHPDAGGDPDAFRRLQAAYEVLLREHGVCRNGDGCVPGAVARAAGFYAHPHAQWDCDTSARRAYWHDMHTEMNMNTNGHGSHTHASNTHYRAARHRPTYGEGLGDDFQADHRASTSSSAGASAGHGQRGADANFSTWYFYHPYESDYRNPYGTGFTDEEIQQAAREQRRGFVRGVARHACLWSGVALVVYLHEQNNRVRRATEARSKGYQNPEYWAQLRKEEAEARAKKRAPLRLEHHWLDAPLVKPVFDFADDDAKGGANAADDDGDGSRQAKRAEERRRQTLGPTRGMLRGGGGSAGGGPRVASYQGRPFTPNGVRGARNTAPKTAKTYMDDTTYEMDDLEDDF